MEILIIGFACYGLTCAALHIASFKISTFWIGMIASAIVILFCKFVCGFALSQSWEYFPVLLLACTGFVAWLGARGLVLAKK